MFGHDDDTQDNTAPDGTAQDNTAAPDSTTFANNDVTINDSGVLDNTAPLTASPDSGAVPSTDDAPQAEETPLLSQTATADEPDAPVATATTSDDDQETSLPPVDDDLIELKKQSLEELAPLVDHLDQTPEEKFRTTMMMIQATDNSSLIKDAHSAALKISDDKIRAQALLDIINEINYFTQVGSANKSNND
ncbi:MAG: hypothetical protein ABI221_00385 [Candidatus Saccharimonadales bacterium]